jgi:hypothetical protein
MIYHSDGKVNTEMLSSGPVLHHNTEAKYIVNSVTIAKTA